MHPKSYLKSLIVFALIMGLISSMSFAQTRKHDISLSYGGASFDQIVDILSDVLTIILVMGTYGKTSMEYSGVPFLTYHYSANSRFGFGVAVGGYTSRGQLQFLGELVGPFKETNYIGALELDYHWVMRKGFQLYSGAGFGVRIRKGTYTDQDATETYSKALPTFHVNLLGFRVGKKVGLFGEIGAGYKGIISGGLNAQF